MPAGRSRSFLQRKARVLDASWRPDQIKLDDRPRGLRRNMIRVGQLGPAAGVGRFVGGILRLGTRPGRIAVVNVGAGLVMIDRTPLLVAPLNAHVRRTTRNLNSLGLAQHREAIELSAAHRHRRLPPTMSPFDAGRIEHQAPLPVDPAGDKAELRPDFIARGLARPLVTAIAHRLVGPRRGRPRRTARCRPFAANGCNYPQSRKFEPFMAGSPEGGGSVAGGGITRFILC